MANGTGQNLFQDWYDTYVKPKKAPISLSSPEPQDFSLGLPSVPTPETPIASPAAEPMQDYTPAPISAPAATAQPSWSESLNKGLADPAKMGLLTAGLSMMATPPRAVPYSGAEIIGNAGLAGVGMFEKALEAKRRQQVLDQTAEEHKLNRDELSLYRKGQLEIGRQNAASSEALKKAAAADRLAKSKLEEAANEAVTEDYWKMIGRDDMIGSKMTWGQLQKGTGPISAAIKPKPTAWKEVNFNGKNQWVDLNSPESKDLAKQGAFGVKDKPGFAYFVSDDGTVTEIQKGAAAGTEPKVVAPPGTGKKTKPSGAGGPKQFEYQDAQAKASLVQKGISQPTIEQIAAERQKLFPKGATKPTRNPRAALTGSTRKVKMLDGSVQEFDAAGNRVK